MGNSRCFLKKYILPQELFDKVSDVLRSGIRASKKQGLRYIYYYTFAFKVGLFRNGSFPELTKTVKIVCQHIYRMSKVPTPLAPQSSYNLSI